MATAAHRRRTAPGTDGSDGSDPLGGRRRHDLDSLLAVAVRIFTERGYDGTSMGDLASASGLSMSSICPRVDGKEQRLRLALERAVESLLAVLSEPATGQDPGINRLEHV